MATITITITDQADYRVQVITHADKPAVGRPLTPAEAVGLDLLATCIRAGAQVDYDAKQIPLVSLALELLHPEGFGFAVTQEVRNAAKQALGPRMAHLVKPVSVVQDGIDIDRVYSTRIA